MSRVDPTASEPRPRPRFGILTGIRKRRDPPTSEGKETTHRSSSEPSHRTAPLAHASPRSLTKRTSLNDLRVPKDMYISWVSLSLSTTCAYRKTCIYHGSLSLSLSLSLSRNLETPSLCYAPRFWPRTAISPKAPTSSESEPPSSETCVHSIDMHFVPWSYGTFQVRFVTYREFQRTRVPWLSRTLSIVFASTLVPTTLKRLT